jgi:hypothetical protein
VARSQRSIFIHTLIDFFHHSITHTSTHRTLHTLKGMLFTLHSIVAFCFCCSATWHVLQLEEKPFPFKWWLNRMLLLQVWSLIWIMYILEIIPPDFNLPPFLCESTHCGCSSNRDDGDPFNMMSDACSICLEDYPIDTSFTIGISNHCRHVFHEACIMQAMKHKPTCPVCRRNIYPVHILDVRVPRKGQSTHRQAPRPAPTAPAPPPLRRSLRLRVRQFDQQAAPTCDAES